MGEEVIRYVALTWLVIAAVLLAPVLAHAGCHHLFKAHHVQQVVAAPAVFYFAGQATQDEAIVRKVVREELQRAQPGTLQQTAPVSVLSQKCARCHTGEAAKGGFDLSQGVTDAEFRRIVEMIGANRNVPDAMKGVIGSLTPEQKGAITDELLNKPAEGVLR